MSRVLRIDPSGTCSGNNRLSPSRAADQRRVCRVPLDEARRLYQASGGQNGRLRGVAVRYAPTRPGRRMS